MLNSTIAFLSDTHNWDRILADHHLKQALSDLFGSANIENTVLDDKSLQTEGHDNGVAIISKHKILETEVLRLAGMRNCLIARTEINGQQVYLVSLYLDKRSDEWRQLAIKDLVNYVSNISVPIIIGGDFNMVGHNEVGIKGQLAKVAIKLGTLTPNETFKHLHSMYYSECGNIMRDNGFIQLAPSPAQYSLPSPYIGLQGILGPFIAPDQIWVRGFKLEQILDSGVSKNNAAAKASDHYPAYATISIPPNLPE